MSPDTTSARTEAPQISLAGRYSVSRGFCWSSGEGAHRAGTEAPLPENTGLPEFRSVRCGVSRLGSQRRHRAASCRRLCAYAEGQCRKMAPVNSFCPQRGASVHVASWGSTLRTANNLLVRVPDIFNFSVSTLSAPRLFSYLLSRSSTVALSLPSPLSCTT